MNRIVMISSYILIMDIVQQFDDCFEIELNYKKIQEVLFMTPSVLLLVYQRYRYQLLEITKGSNLTVIQKGELPANSESISRFNNNCVALIQDNRFMIFDLYQKASIHQYSIVKSDIYSEQFLYQANYLQASPKILFYKLSVLKTTPATIYCDLNLLNVEKQLTKIKKLKVQYQQIRKFGFGCGQMFSYQITGFSVEIIFLQSMICHKINSIFNLFLLDLIVWDNDIQLNFTHQEMENQYSSYLVSKNRVKKMQRKKINIQPHSVSTIAGLRSIVYKNGFNCRKKDPKVAIFRVKFTKATHYLQFIDQIVPNNAGIAFKQNILDLLF